MKLLMHEEIEINDRPNKKHFTVSGDGTWRQRVFSSLYGVASLVRYYTGKIVDIVVRSAYCKLCQVWTGKEDAVEYEEWKGNLEPKCTANHSGSAENMEVNAMIQNVFTF